MRLHQPKPWTTPERNPDSITVECKPKRAIRLVSVQTECSDPWWYVQDDPPVMWSWLWLRGALGIPLVRALHL